MLETRRHQADAAGVRLRAVLRPTFDRSVFADTTIANELVSRVWVQDQTHWRRGALIGAAVTAVVSVAMMVSVASVIAAVPGTGPVDRGTFPSTRRG